MGNHSLLTNHMLFLVLFICEMLFSCCREADTNISCIESERRSLLDFKDGLIDISNRLSSWTGENCCKWEGIACNIHTGRVVKLDLHNPIAFDVERFLRDKESHQSYHNSSLRGEINPSLLHLEHLQHLDLSMNNFSGIQIPFFFGSFKYMRYLNLSRAYSHVQNPSHLGNMSRLQYLDLSNCYIFNAKSLWWITRVSSLMSLDLSGADLSEAYDWLQVINLLPSLLSINLGSCNLYTIPPVSHVNITSLVSIDLSGNDFNTSFPLWLFNLSIENLSLEMNSFQGKLPNLFEMLTSLTKLDLSSNDFKSSIPNSLCTLTNLTHVDLSANSFRGKLPFCLQNLTSLTSLQLRNNRFRGTIPFQIGHLGKLTELDISHNKLEGTIPSSLGQLEKLQSLDISSNSFAGELTELHFAKLTELKSLDISWTTLHVNVSSQWFPPFQLLKIFMHCTPVGPQFPPWLESQKRVVKLQMYNASISDTIPNWFEVVYSHINFLDLSFNQISGKPPQFEGAKFPDYHDGIGWIDLSFNKFVGSLNSIPRYVDAFIMSSNSFTGQIPSLDGNGTTFLLENLILNDNGFTGNIPSAICNIKSLAFLDLSNNNLSGKIPFCLGNLQNLELLNLANNSLFGQIPGSLGNLGSLFVLRLKGNKFDGKIPLSMQNLTSLAILDLGDNQLSGTLPRWFGEELQNLAWLRLQSNNFHGDIPLELCELSNLQMLNLAQNNFTGVIPRCFGNFSAMTLARSVPYFQGYTVPSYLMKRQLTFSNLIKGGDLEYSMGFMSVRSIALSENKIVGEIPRELMDLLGLQSLTLSKNHLQGRIPENIGNLKSLESLDFSMNQLSGSIPPSLATIDTLGYLNLSFNKLSGQIPQANHFQTFDNISIYEGNIGLCGKPLLDCTDDKPSKKDGPLDLHHRESSHVSWFYAGIGPGFAVGFMGVFSLFLFKKSWRYAYFRFVENLCSSMWIRIVVKFSLLLRKFKRVNV